MNVPTDPPPFFRRFSQPARIALLKKRDLVAQRKGNLGYWVKGKPAGGRGKLRKAGSFQSVLIFKKKPRTRAKTLFQQRGVTTGRGVLTEGGKKRGGLN